MLLALCSCNHLKSGEIVAKKYIPGYWQLTPQVTSCGKETTVTMISIYYPEQYIITVKGVYKTKVRTEDHTVDKKEYDTCHLRQIHIFK